MNPTITHHSVNWIDGMKVSQQHFFDQENHLLDVIRDSRAIPLNDYNYGIMRAHNENDPIKVEMVGDTLVLYRCRGITAGGNRIEIVEERMAQHMIYDLRELVNRHHLNAAVNMSFVAVVRIDPFKRIPGGEINAEEQPPRHPWAYPFYQLDVIREEEFNRLEMLTTILPVKKLTWQNDKFVLHQRFIPPCTSINVLPKLKDKYETYRMTLSSIYDACLRIIRKIKNEGQSNIFNANIFIFATDLGQFLAANFDEFNLTYSNNPPIFLLRFMCKLVRTVEMSLVRLREEDRILGYISDNSRLTPAQFKQAMSDLLNLRYNHMEIIELLDKIDKFLHPFSDVIQKLDTANLMNRYH